MSAFPFSHEQIHFLHSYQAHMDNATGNPDADVDILMMNDLRGLMNSMANNDHIDDSSPHRFYIDCTIEIHAHKIIEKLEYVSIDERTRDIPSSVPEGSMVNTANFITKQLGEIFGTVFSEEPRQLFHDELREVYNRMINIFGKPNLTYFDHQKQLIRGILESIDELGRSTSTTTHEDIHLRFFGFMDSLRQERPEHERLEFNGTYFIDSDGPISKAVYDITWDLLYLQRVAEEHFDSFPLFVSRIPNITQVITRYFLRFYPQNSMAPLSSTSSPGSSSSG